MPAPVQFGAYALKPYLTAPTRTEDKGVPYFAFDPYIFDQRAIQLRDKGLEAQLNQLSDDSVIVISPDRSFTQLAQYGGIGELTRTLRNTDQFNHAAPPNVPQGDMKKIFGREGMDLDLFRNPMSLEPFSLVHRLAQRVFAPYAEVATAEHFISAARMHTKKRTEVVNNEQGDRMFDNAALVQNRKKQPA